jgi:hypothetical protein
VWQNNLKRLRRFLRDPNAKIWSDAFLLQLWNDAQDEMNKKTGYLVKVEASPVPPDYDIAYLYDWEWAFLPAGHGYCHQALQYYEQGDHVITDPCEGQVLAGVDETQGLGPHFTLPWEGFMTPCADPVSLNFPYGFSVALLVTWNRWPMEYLAKKELTSEDPSWKIRGGRPFQYWRFDALEDVFFLYPRPSAVNWPDLDVPPDQDRQVGMVTGIPDLTLDSDYGTIADIPGYFSNQDRGIVTEVIPYANNVIFIFEAEPTKIENLTDESDWPDFLQKYVEYCALHHAFNANTDGKNDALRDFWGKRMEWGIQVIKTFMDKRYEDRNYRLVTKRGIPGMRNRRQPRLPDTYPVSY